MSKVLENTVIRQLERIDGVAGWMLQFHDLVEEYGIEKIHGGWPKEMKRKARDLQNAIYAIESILGVK